MLSARGRGRLGSAYAWALPGTFLGRRRYMILETALALTLSGPAVLAESQPPPLAPAQQSAPAPTPPQQTADGSDQKDQKDPKAEQKEPPTPPHTGIRALFGNLVEDVKHLPAKQNLYLIGIGGGLAAVAHPADQTFNVRLRSHYDG